MLILKKVWREIKLYLVSCFSTNKGKAEEQTTHWTLWLAKGRISYKFHGLHSSGLSVSMPLYRWGNRGWGLEQKTVAACGKREKTVHEELITLEGKVKATPTCLGMEPPLEDSLLPQEAETSNWFFVNLNNALVILFQKWNKTITSSPRK